MGTRHIGVISLSAKILLTFLQYEDLGEICQVSYNAFNDTINITLEHPEMPLCDYPQIVMPVYITHQDNVGNRVTIRDRE